MQPKSDPTRPLIVPQEYLIINDDMSPYATIPEKSRKHITSIKTVIVKTSARNWRSILPNFSNEKKYIHRTALHSCTINNLYIKREKVIVELTEKVKKPNIQIKEENDKEISELLLHSRIKIQKT